MLRTTLACGGAALLKFIADHYEGEGKKVIGGDEGDRTPDLCNAIAALSQLSYVPVFNAKCRMHNAE